MANSTTSTTDSNGIFKYDPSKTAALIAAALFGLSAQIHLFQMIRKKTWFYTPMTIGAIMMTAGYVFRYLSAKSPGKVMLYALQSLLILLPPSLYAATMYMIYGRIVLFVNAPEASIIRPTRVTKIFVIGDVLSFFIQSGGGGMMVQAGSAALGQSRSRAEDHPRRSLLAAFILRLLPRHRYIFYNRIMRSHFRYTIPKYGKHTWRSLLILLLAAAVVIILRCVYRVVEFAEGQDGFLMGKEVFMYVGDAALMFFVQAYFHFVHAGDVFPKGGMGKLEEESYIALPDLS